MIDYHLKFASESEANSVLYENDQFKYPNTDIIGLIYKPTEDQTPEMQPISGWHVNVRNVDVLSELEPYHVEVKTPVRVWA